MSVLSDAQKSALFGRLLGLPSPTPVDQYGMPIAPGSAGSSVTPERIAPTGTVAGYLPGLGAAGSNPVVLIGVGLVAVLAVVFLAKKVL